MENIEQKQPTTREAVILDALRLLHVGKLRALHGTFIDSAQDNSRAIQAGEACSVCALGSLFYSRFQLTDAYVSYLSWRQLYPLFSKEELRVIEAVFEGTEGLLTGDSFVPLDDNRIAVWAIWSLTGVKNPNLTLKYYPNSRMIVPRVPPQKHLENMLCNMLMNGGAMNLDDFTEYDTAAVLRTYGFNSQGEKNDV